MKTLVNLLILTVVGMIVTGCTVFDLAKNDRKKNAVSFPPVAYVKDTNGNVVQVVTQEPQVAPLETDQSYRLRILAAPDMVAAPVAFGSSASVYCEPTFGGGYGYSGPAVVAQGRLVVPGHYQPSPTGVYTAGNVNVGGGYHH